MNTSQINKKLILGIVIGLCVIIGIMYILPNMATGNYIIVKDKYVYQYFEPKPTQSKLLDKRPKCGLDLLNIVVKYYVVDTLDNKYEITESEYTTIKVGSKFKINEHRSA